MQNINITNHQIAQQCAKETIHHLIKAIHAGMTEEEIVKVAERFLNLKGIQKFWYYGVGAFVFVGKRTCISESGKTYQPTNTKVKEEDIITVDLGPEKYGCWGDFARTLVVSGGKVIGVNTNEIAGAGIKEELFSGILAEEKLHSVFAETISPEKTFDDLFTLMNAKIKSMGYVNLDFKGNLGHTIEKKMPQRKYIEKGNKIKFGDVGLFTFEPHIKSEQGIWGFKREDIYYFSNNKLKFL